MDNCHNYATTSKKRRIPISDDIHIIIKKFRDKDKHDEKNPASNDSLLYDESESLDSEPKRIRQEPSSSSTSNIVASTSSASAAQQSEDIKLILKKLTNIEELLKVVADQSFNRLTTIKGSNISFDHQQQQQHISIDNVFKFPIRTLKELVELNKSICGDETLYNKLFEYLTKLRLECDDNLMNALNSIMTQELLNSVNWDGINKFKLSSLVIFSDSLYVALFKDKMKYDEYVAEMKDAIMKSHNRYAKVKMKREDVYEDYMMLGTDVV